MMFRIYYRVMAASGKLAPFVSVYDCKDDADYERALDIALKDGYEIVDIEYINEMTNSEHERYIC